MMMNSSKFLNPLNGGFSFFCSVSVCVSLSLPQRRRRWVVDVIVIVVVVVMVVVVHRFCFLSHLRSILLDRNCVAGGSNCWRVVLRRRVAGIGCLGPRL
ncbi:hypothetical protein F5X96DRAFT_615051 [Biscogniauxia mediterranea]|nr:hypothetical protein F5X96DRAFT_615051 [Biscogniauxia mediterranea]